MLLSGVQPFVTTERNLKASKRLVAFRELTLERKKLCVYTHTSFHFIFIFHCLASKQWHDEEKPKIKQRFKAKSSAGHLKQGLGSV